MNEKQYQEAAAEFLNIWQKQISAMMVDQKLVQSFLQMFQNMPSNNYAKPTQSAADPAPASDPRDDLLAQLAFRLARCEKRLSALEGQKTHKPTPQRKPKKSATGN